MSELKELKSDSAHEISKHTWNDAETSEDEIRYASWSVSAILSLVFGTLSFLIFVNLWCGFFGVFAIILSLFSLRAIARADGGLIGRRAALAGIGLAISSVVAVSVFWQGYIYFLRQDADQFCRLWLSSAQRDDIPLMMGMTLPHWDRVDLSDRAAWWEALSRPEEAETLRAVEKHQENKVFLRLKSFSDMEITLFRAEPIVYETHQTLVPIIYAVTNSDAEKSSAPQTSLIRLVAVQQRGIAHGKKVSGWSLQAPLPELFWPECVDKKVAE